MPERLCTIQTGTGGIATLTFGGSRSSVTERLESLQRQLVSAAGKEDIKGILLTGPADEFCPVTAVQCATPHAAATLSALGQAVAFNLEKIGRPCISVIEGDCTGLGLELALATDFIIAGSGARFGFPGISAGMLPFCGGSQRLPRLVGKAKAKELIFSGEMIPAAEAHRIGLINRLYPSGGAAVQALALLEQICTRSPNAIRVGGEVVNAGYDIDLQTACLLERNAFALCFASFDQREGMTAFLDKRTPQFKGE